MEGVIEKLDKYLFRFTQISDIFDLLLKDDYYLNQGWSKVKILDLHDLLVKWAKTKELLIKMRENLFKILKNVKKHKTAQYVKKLNDELNKFRYVLKDFYQAYDYFEALD